MLLKGHFPRCGECPFSVVMVIGVNTLKVIERLYADAKLKDYYRITYNTLMPYVKDILKERKKQSSKEKEGSKTQGIVRGAGYYKRGGINE